MKRLLLSILGIALLLTLVGCGRTDEKSKGTFTDSSGTNTGVPPPVTLPTPAGK